MTAAFLFRTLLSLKMAVSFSSEGLVVICQGYDILYQK